jgi:hypothetical protein
MTYTLNLGRRVARFRALLIALFAISFAACDTADQLTSSTPTEEPTVPEAVEPTAAPADPADLTVEDTLGATDPNDPTGGVPIDDEDDEDLPEELDVEADDIGIEVVGSTDAAAAEGLSFSSRFRGGIPLGVTQTPKTLLGRHSGGLTNASPRVVLSYLEAARRTGTRVMLVFSGNERYYQNRNRSFNFNMWKARVARYRGINFSSYIKDGTIIGHRMIDEAHDRGNWGGAVVSRVQLEAMAKYSKTLWPGMATIVRSWPAYLRGYRYRYLDAAWAQYASRFGNVSGFLNKNVSDAKAAGLALVVGINQLHGVKAGRRKVPVSGSQLKSWGSTLLSNSYPCAFLNWMYNDRYMARADVKAAFTFLSGRARSRPTRSCGS